YLDGDSLGGMLKDRGKLPIALVTDILEQVCLAVGNAHKLGVIHRDLKPDNIWLQPDGRGGYIAKVLDFGLAKLRDPNELQLHNRSSGGGESRGMATLPAGARTTAPQAGQTAAGEDSRRDTQLDARGATAVMDRQDTRPPEGSETALGEG